MQPLHLLLISAGFVHPSLWARFQLRQGLSALPDCRIDRAASLEALPGLPLADYDGMVLYMHHEALSDAAFRALDDFVQRGGGLLAVHSASASFKEHDGYYDLLGGRFVEHGAIEPYRVEPALRNDPIFAGIPAFTIRDELYRHEWLDDVRVRFTVSVDGEREPVVWTRACGEGRVCYAAPGHTASSMHNPRMRTVLRRGLLWACGREADLV